jgi:hypothetical protein
VVSNPAAWRILNVSATVSSSISFAQDTVPHVGGRHADLSSRGVTGRHATR